MIDSLEETMDPSVTAWVKRDLEEAARHARQTATPQAIALPIIEEDQPAPRSANVGPAAARFTKRRQRHQRDHQLVGRSVGKVRWDERAIAHLLRAGQLRSDLGKAYTLSLSFLLDHRFGWVDTRPLKQRRRACARCAYRVKRKLWHVGKVSFCSGANGGRGCGCPETTAWPPGWLRYRLGLGAMTCPLEKFTRRQPWFVTRSIAAIEGITKRLRACFKPSSNWPL